MSNFFRGSLLVVFGLMIAASAMADVWDETANGGGDAGDFPTGTSQNATNSTFDQITGVLLDVDVDAYCIEITAATWTAEVVAGTETDTRLWVFDMAGVLLMANDDSSQVGGSLQSLVSDTTTFVSLGEGGLVDSPTDPVVGTNYALVINGFGDDALDTAAAPLSAINSNFSALVGIDPASTGTFGSWEGVTQGGGTYDIVLTGAVLCDVPLPVTLQSFSID